MAAQDSARPVSALGSIEAEGEAIVAALSRAPSATVSYLVTADTLIAWLTIPGGEIDVVRLPLSRDSIAALVTTVRGGLGVDGPAARGFGGPASLDPASDVTAALAELAPSSGPATARIRRATEAAALLSSVALPARWRSRLSRDTEIVVVTHGPFTLLPFAVLPLDPDASLDSTASGLGSAYAIRYAPSLTALIDVESRAGESGARPPRFRDALIAGNPTMPTIRGEGGVEKALPPLPEAATESRWVGELLQAAPLIGDAATERAVRARMPSAQIVHLATHGFAFAWDARARESFVALASDELHDGRLTVGEILDDPALRLQAELVVLSACQTGLGDLKEAEGTVGLPRAFLARGARSVLVSLWSVSDEATRLLMERFYSHWLDDADAPTKAKALQRAADDVRRTEGFEHPRFWAAFQLIGAR
jgi:CHAT domain-containing protein